MVPYLYNGWYVSSDTSLTVAQVQVNGNKIAAYFHDKGWTAESICAVLGNVRAESVMNPGNIEDCPAEWQSVFPTNSEMMASSFVKGLGLTQWTPGRDTLVPYADTLNIPWYNGDVQCLRLYYEQQNNINWVPITLNGTYYTWNRFIQTSGDVNTVNELTEVFVRCYERPGEAAIIATLANRQFHAREWYHENPVVDFPKYMLWNGFLNNKRKVMKKQWKAI